MSKQPEFFCARCRFQSPSKYHLAAHLQYSHKSKSLTDFSSTSFDECECLECGRICSKLGNLYKHLWWIHLPPQLNCSKCHDKFKLPPQLKTHLRTKHGVVEIASKNKIHKCSSCGKICKTLASLKKHSYIHMPKRYSCDECEKPFATYLTYALHMKLVHEPESSKSTTEQDGRKLYEYICARCEERFPTKCHLQRHLTKSHDMLKHVEPDLDYVCPICMKVWDDFEHFKRHVSTHGPRKFQCAKCPSKFKDQDHLNRHLFKCHHVKQIEFHCGDCGKLFKRSSMLKRHSQIHNPPQYCCEVCRMEFPFRNSLMTHFKSVHMGLIVKMNTGNNRTKNNAKSENNGKTPWRVTETSKFHKHAKFECSQCELKLYSQEHLVKHMKLVHNGMWKMPTKWSTNQPRHNCAICCRPFVHKGRLHRHLSIHYRNPLKYSKVATDESSQKRIRSIGRFVCAICISDFIKRADLIEHLQLHQPSV